MMREIALDPKVLRRFAVSQAVMLTAVLLLLALITQDTWARPSRAAARRKAAQAKAKNNAQKAAATAIELLGGIEIGSKGVKAIVIKVANDTEADGEAYKLNKLFESTHITTIMRRDEKNRFTADAINDTANAVRDYYKEMTATYNVPSANIHIIGSSGLNAVNPDDLRNAVRERVGKDMDGFLSPEDEATLMITGTIPRQVQIGRKRVMNREISVLVDIGSGNTKGGYREVEKGANSGLNYSTFDFRQATVTFTTAIEKEMAAKNLQGNFSQVASSLSGELVRKPLRDATERKPGLINRQRVYLTGGIVWAMVSLLRPEEVESNFVEVTPEMIRTFREMAANQPAQLLNPDLEKKIPNADLRAKAEKELNSVRKVFTPNNLIAGSEILSVISDELSLKNRRIRFARQGVWGWILSYTALQAGQTVASR